MSHVSHLIHKVIDLDGILHNDPASTLNRHTMASPRSISYFTVDKESEEILTPCIAHHHHPTTHNHRKTAYPTTQYHTMSCHAIPCHTIPYNTIRYNTLRYTIRYTVRYETIGFLSRYTIRYTIRYDEIQYITIHHTIHNTQYDTIHDATHNTIRCDAVRCVTIRYNVGYDTGCTILVRYDTRRDDTIRYSESESEGEGESESESESESEAQIK